jgi:hypothetical protein
MHVAVERLLDRFIENCFDGCGENIFADHAFRCAAGGIAADSGLKRAGHGLKSARKPGPKTSAPHYRMAIYNMGRGWLTMRIGKGGTVRA